MAAPRPASAVSTSAETMVPLAAFATYGPGNTPLAVNHQGLFVASTISFNLAPGKSLSDAVAAIDARSDQIGMPASIHGSFQGTAQVFQQSLANEPCLILAALVAVYIVLGILYESYIHPITILSTLPSAGVGAVLALMAMRTRIQHHRPDRRHPADRHRQEERDHDDRLRARCRAQPQPRVARGDLSGLPAALPADHDDDDGGACSAPCRWRSASARAASCAGRSASPSSAA